MTDLATLKAEVADDVARSDLTAAIAAAITEAIDFYCDHPFWFTRDRDATFPTVASQSTYSSSDDADIGTFYRLKRVYLEDGGNVYDLREMDITEWQDLQDVATEARPYAYARLNDQYYFYPTPDSAYTVRMIGHKQIAAPASDSEASNPWMNEGYQLIRSRAVKNIYAKKIRSYQDAQIWDIEEERQFDRLIRTSNKKVGSGMIEAAAF